jgi:hypothetical protein
MTTKEKLLEYIKFKGISKSKFYSDTGLSNGFLDQGKSLVVDKLENILNAYSDLSMEWLIFGRGSMIVTEQRHDVDEVNDPPVPYYACSKCEEKQKQIDLLNDYVNTLKSQNTQLLQEWEKDREIIRKMVPDPIKHR